MKHVGIVFNWSNIIGIIAFLKVGVFFYQAHKTNPMITDQSTDDPYVSLPDYDNYCKSGNIRENLILANIRECVASRK